MLVKGKKKTGNRIGNRGLSIVEVVVAIAILSLVTVPLLQTFISAIRYNATARENQRVLNIAQSVMEGIKAHDAEELSMQFANDPLHPFTVYSGIGTGTYWEVLPPALSDYEYILDGITYDGVAYDVKVDVNTIGTSTLTQMDSINEYKDAVYKQATTQNSVMYNTVMTAVVDELNLNPDYVECTLADLDEDNVYIKKVTTVSMNRSGSPGDYAYTVSVQSAFTYQVIDFERERLDDGTLEEVDIDEQTISDTLQVIYDSTSTKANGAFLEDVYFFYYPAYDRETTGNPIDREEIVFQNNTGEVRKVYLVKQYTEGLSESVLSTSENSYRPYISGTGSGEIKLYHNVTENLSSAGGSIPVGSMSGVTAIEGLVETVTEPALYEVKVSVYETNAMEAGFPESMRLLELEGSKNE